jgi:hypothetical protein
MFRSAAHFGHAQVVTLFIAMEGGAVSKGRRQTAHVKGLRTSTHTDSKCDQQTAVRSRLLTGTSRFALKTVSVGCVVDKRKWESFLSESFDYPCQYHSTAAHYSVMYHLQDGQCAHCCQQFHKHINSTVVTTVVSKQTYRKPYNQTYFQWT